MYNSAWTDFGHFLQGGSKFWKGFNNLRKKLAPSPKPHLKKIKNPLTT